jgi:transcription elongation factor Elf1
MKILSTPTEWTKQFTCPHCNAELEVSGSDLYVVNEAVGYAGETWEPEIHYECPVCKTSNRITRKVPGGLASDLMS